MPLTALTAWRHKLPVAALLLGLLAGPSAFALGLDQPQMNSRLGQRLDMSFPLSLSANEALSEQCLKAEVQAGDARVPAGLLQLKLEGGTAALRVRLTSLVRIDESPVQVTLAVGCPSRLTRDFVIAVEAVQANPSARPATPLPAALPRSERQAEPEPRASLVAASAPAPQARPAKPHAPHTKARHARATPERRAPQPRLQLEAPEVLVAPVAAASAPSAPAAEEDMDQVLARLEAQVAALQTEIKARQSAAASAPEPEAAPSAASAASEADEIPTVVPPAIAAPHSAHRVSPMTWLWTFGLMLMAGGATYIWSERRLRSRLQALNALAAAHGGTPVAPLPEPDDSEPAPLRQAFAPAVPAPRPQPGRMVAAPRDVPQFGSSHLDTQPLERRMAEPPPPPQPVAAPSPVPEPMPPQADALAAGVDALLELQQQAEFLALLGQHDATLDLLAERVNQGAGGPMPFLMLMELCQQRGDAAAFAELTRLFDARFGSMAPAWQHSISRGRGLDASPSVIAHLQVVWADPAAALRMLVELIVRGSGPGVPSFELPAYRDLLLLYAVARDLHEGNQVGAGAVDLEL